MSEPVTIIVPAGGASQDILETCVDSVRRHTEQSDFEMIFACASHQVGPASYVADKKGVTIVFEDVEDDGASGSTVHGRLLDQVVRHSINTELLLTLDADCFPVRDGWLHKLRQFKDDAAVSGILWPYAPPPPEMSAGLERGIRSQLCWNNTHVACQMTSRGVLRELGVGFSDGNDTGLAIPARAREAGMRVKGLMPTRCAKPDEGHFDPELNRETCVIFGDLVYHHGRGCRETQGRGSSGGAWDGVRDKVLLRRGAEFLLSDDDSHEYVFDREEEAARLMTMDVMGGMMRRLQADSTS